MHKGIAYIVIAAFWFAVMGAVAHYLSKDFHPFMLVLIRNVVALAIVIPWALAKRTALFPKSKRKAYLLRGLFSQAGNTCWFSAIASMTLPLATALSFTTPLFATIAAVLWLKEPVSLRRWLALAIGFIGVLIILRPGMQPFDQGWLWVLAASVFWATTSVMIRNFASSSSPLEIVLNLMVLMTPLALPLALLHWQWPPLAQWPWLLLMGLSALLWQYCLGCALKHAPVAWLQPFEFTRLIFATALGYFCFAERLDLISLLGAVIIFLSAFYVTRKEIDGFANV